MKKLFDFIEEMFQNEKILYLFFGVLTTFVNYLVFFIADFGFNLELKYANILAWLAAVSFAFVVNKRFVFKKKSKDFADLIKEISTFVFARIFTFLFEHFALIYANQTLGINAYIAKAFLAIVVIIVNYIVSKFGSFKK